LKLYETFTSSADLDVRLGLDKESEKEIIFFPIVK
jgi:hypothetical protein